MELSFGLASFLTGLLSLILAVAVFLGNPALKENRAWALASLSVAVWGGGLGFAILAQNKEQSLLWNRIFYTGGVWIPTTFLWFVSVFTKKNVLKLFLVFSVILSFCLNAILYLRIEWFVVDLVQRGPFRYWDVLGPAYHVFSIFFFLNMSYAFSHFYRAFKADSSIDRSRTRWIFIGMGIGVFGGATNFFFDYNIQIYPFGQFLVFLYPLLVSWAIIRYQALDVGILLRKTSLLIFIYILLILTVVPILLFLKEYMGLEGSKEVLAFSIGAILAGSVLSLGPFMYAYFVRKSRFFHEHTLAGIAHELKSPIAAIEGALEVLSSQSENIGIEENQKAYFKMIEKNALRLNRFVNDLLQAFKLEGKTSHLRFEIVDARGLVRDAVELLKPLADQKNLRLEVRLPPRILKISCDIPKIGQVLSNFLSNAIKYTDEGKISINLIGEEKEVIFEFKDTGRGMSPDEIPHVFDRFYQGEAGRRNKGTGIGLTIARMWVETHGGKVHVESDGLGKGSRFWFTLPC